MIGSRDISMQGTPTCVDFVPKTGSSFIVTHSNKISLFKSSGEQLQRSYSRFSSDAYSGKFRRDGKLLVAGDGAGYVKVFDVKTKVKTMSVRIANKLTLTACNRQHCVKFKVIKHPLRLSGGRLTVWAYYPPRTTRK